MEKLIKYHLHVQYHKKRLFEKEKLSNRRKTIHYFLKKISMNDSIWNQLRPKWEIQMDLENDLYRHQIRPG